MKTCRFRYLLKAYPSSRKLDAAVFDAYGWPHDATSDAPADLSDDEVLARLLALNLERAARQGEVPVVEAVEGSDGEE